ncbi:MAG: hypothetical protein KatS3mg054_1159 [Chloroflexus sp.]|nr:MAG: hypothetical protein KatS3mg054_1159 [Chloroflexus sp.]
MALSMVLLFLLAGMSTASAQASTGLTDGITAVPQGNFITPESALIVVENHLGQVATQMKSVPVGSGAYKAALLEHTYFTAINDNIGNGMSVPQSIGESLKAVMTDVLPATKAQLITLKQTAIDLLSQ